MFDRFVEVKGTHGHHLHVGFTLNVFRVDIDLFRIKQSINMNTDNTKYKLLCSMADFVFSAALV